MRPPVLAAPALLLCALGGLALAALCAAGLLQALPASAEGWRQALRFGPLAAPAAGELALAALAAPVAALLAMPALGGLAVGAEEAVRRRLGRMTDGLGWTVVALILAPGVPGAALLQPLRGVPWATPVAGLLLALPVVLWAGAVAVQLRGEGAARQALASLGAGPGVLFRRLVLPRLWPGLALGTLLAALLAPAQCLLAAELAGPEPWALPLWLVLPPLALLAAGGALLALTCLGGLFARRG